MAEANEKMVKVGGKEIAQSEIDKALALLEKQKLQRAKQAEKNKNNPDVIAKRKEYSTKQRVKNQLLIKKAIAAGITVTDKEVDDALKAA